MSNTSFKISSPCVWIFREFFFFSSRRRHTRFDCDWSSDVCSSDLRVDRSLRAFLSSTRSGVEGAWLRTGSLTGGGIVGMAFMTEKYNGNRPTLRGQDDDPSGDPHRARPPDRGGPGPLAAILPGRAGLRGDHAIRLGCRLRLGRGLSPPYPAQYVGRARRAATAPRLDRPIPPCGFLSAS